MGRRSPLVGMWVVTMTLAPVATVQAHAQLSPNLHYDGRLTLARIKYDPLPEPMACQGADSPAGAGWGHDYPGSVRNMLSALKSVTTANDVVTDSNLVIRADDSLLLKHPIAMITEPGCWNPTDKEAQALRGYLRKGGFLIVDDMTFFFATEELGELAINRFESWLERVLPGARPVPLAPESPIFDGFFKIDPSHVPTFGPVPAQVTGVYENNDPTKRLLLVANYWTSLGEYWVYVDNDLGSGLEQGGDVFKLGINYMIYGLSH